MKLFGISKKNPNPDDEYIRIINEANAQHDEIIANAIIAKKQIEHQALDDIRSQKRQLEQELQQLQDDLQEIESIADSFSSNPWEGSELKPSEYKEKIKIIQSKISELIENKRAAVNLKPFETNEEIRDYTRRYSQITRLFCAEADIIAIEAVKKPFGLLNRKIAKAFKDINKLFEKDNIAISDLLLELEVQQCIAIYYASKK